MYLRRLPRALRRPQPPKQFKYADDSGQVYTESTCRALTRQDHDWASISSGEPPERVPRDSPTGAPTLQAIAIHAVLQNLDSLTHEVLEWVPWVIAEKLWIEIERHNLKTLNLWRIFTTIYGHEAFEIGSFECSLPSPKLPLASYLGRFTSSLPQWLTYLSISTTHSSRADLLCLSSLSNLAAIALYHPYGYESSVLDDRLFRAWSRAAAESGAYANLCMLCLRGYPGVTSQSLEYLSLFPSLMVALYADCGVAGYSNQNDWRQEKSSGVQTALQIEQFLTLEHNFPPDKEATWYNGDMLREYIFRRPGRSPNMATAERIRAPGERTFSSTTAQKLPILHSHLGIIEKSMLTMGAAVHLYRRYQPPCTPVVNHVIAPDPSILGDSKKGDLLKGTKPAAPGPTRKKRKLREDTSRPLNTLLDEFQGAKLSKSR